MAITCSIYCGRTGLDGIYLETWLLGNTSGYRRKGNIIYCDLTAEQAEFLRDEGWSVRVL